MSTEVWSILKTCSTCKSTFPTIRELIKHESEHHPKEPAWPLRRPAIRQLATSSSSIKFSRDLSIDNGPTSDQKSRTSNEPDFLYKDSQERVNLEKQIKSNLGRSAADFGPDFKKARLDQTLGTEVGNSTLNSASDSNAESTAGSISSKTKNEAINNRYVCEYCLADFGTRKYLIRHQLSLTHYGIDWKLSYFCSKCNKGEKREFFKGKMEFEEHMAMVHGELSIADRDHRFIKTGDQVNLNATSLVSEDRSGSILNNIGSIVATDTDQSTLEICGNVSSGSEGISALAGESTSISMDQSISTIDKNISTDQTSKSMVNPMSSNDWFCKFCLWSYKNYVSLYYHRAKYHYFNYPIYYCLFCPSKPRPRRYFMKESKFYAHIAKVHGLVDASIEKTVALKNTNATLDEQGIDGDQAHAMPKFDQRNQDLANQVIKDDPDNSTEQLDNGNISMGTAQISTDLPITSAWMTVLKNEPLDIDSHEKIGHVESDQGENKEINISANKRIKTEMENGSDQNENQAISANIDSESTSPNAFLATIKEELEDFPNEQEGASEVPDFVEIKPEPVDMANDLMDS